MIKGNDNEISFRAVYRPWRETWYAIDGTGGADK